MDYIIELALNEYTDFCKLEELATRILNDEGYESIHAIGGIGDDGVDAEEVKYFQDSTERTVFQYSLDKRNKQKIIDSIEKLKANKIQFQSLVFVTINQINNTQVLKTEIRKKYKNTFEIEIIERKTIKARLAANNYTLFNIYFPSVRSQIESKVFDKKIYFTDESTDLIQTSLLKCSLLFTFNTKAQITRKNLLDKLILSLVVSQKKTSIPEIAEILKNKFSRVLQDGQIKAAIQRMSKEDFVKEKDGKILTTKKATEYLEGNVAGVNEATDALVNDIIEKLKDLNKTSLDKGIIARIKTNIQNSLSAFFRLHGLDYAISKQTHDKVISDFDKNTALIVITKEGLSEKVGSLLVYAIGDTIKNPSEEQAEILSHWAKAFIGLQVMNLDPTLREFQTTSFAKKTFIIDTDFLLYCLVEECNLNKVYKRFVRELKALNCKLVIPSNVITEVLKHGEAENNYNYFRSTFQTVDENIVDERIHNVFVKGYYTGLLNGTISKSTSFKQYLKNYIDKDSPYDFLQDLIHYYYPDTFVIKDLADISKKSIDPDLLLKLTNRINEMTKSTFKAQWRNEEENHEVSLNDAKMYLTTYFLNDSNANDVTAILPGSFYLLTSSTRAAKCGLREGLTTTISVKPETLIGLLEQLGSFEISSKEFINIFENPYLVEITSECWNDIKILIDCGVDLKDKNPVRLSYDLKESIHDFITDRKKYETGIVDEEIKEQEAVELKDFEKFVNHVKSKGYKFTPTVESILEKFKDMQTDIKLKDKVIQEMREKTSIFGRRKQKYLDRIANKAKNKN